MAKLTGYRTYLVGAVIFVLGGLKALGVFDTPDSVLIMLGAIGGITMRSAVKR